MHKYSCFNCHEQGHWAKDCPSKSPNKSPPSVRGGPSTSLDHPVIQCRCGKGPCTVFVSKTEKNPGRKFYSCPVPGAGRCRFFKWCDEIKDNGHRIVAPKCSCGAGFSRRETETSGPNAGRSYFVCPIRKGFGACKFFLWENSQVDSKVNEREDESKGYGSPQSTCDSHRIFDIVNNNLHKSDDLSLEQPGSPEFGLQKTDNPPADLLNSTIMSISSSQDGVLLTENQESGKTSDILSVSQHDPSPFVVPENESSALDSMNGNLVTQEAEPWDSMMEKTEIVRLRSQTAIPCQRLESSRQISAAVDISKRCAICISSFSSVIPTICLCKDVIHQNFGLHMLGWLGRLAFPPSRCLTDRPRAPFFCVIYPSFNPICVPRDRDMLYSEGSTALSHCLSNADLDKSSPSIPGEDPLLWNSDLQKPSGLKRSSATMDDTETSTLLKFEQTVFYMNQLLTIWKSIDPSDQNSMARGAIEVFSVLNSLSIDNNCDLRFDAIEQSDCNEGSMEELIELYNERKVQFDDISKVHEKAVTDFTASCKCLESLNGEASCVRDMLSQIENQLLCCEAETSNLKTHVDVSSRDVLEFKRSMQEAEEALKLRKQREEKRSAAKAALEKIFGSSQDVCGLHLRKRRKIELLQLEESSTSQKAAR